MNVRENLLWAGHNAMKKFRSNVVSWKTIGDSSPPDTYHVTYNVNSIIGFKDNQPQYHKGFSVEINFPLDYPQHGLVKVHFISRPFIFHPNLWLDGRFDNNLGTQAAGEPPDKILAIDVLCQVVGEIISFQIVNLSSPANIDMVLRDWVIKNLRFKDSIRVINPVDASPIRLPDIEQVKNNVEIHKTNHMNVKFNTCFISYSTKDEKFARKLYASLHNNGIAVWFAPEDIKGGVKIHEQLEYAIQNYDKLLLILSENSINSEWVITEIRNARRFERESKERKLFPIRLVDFETLKKWKCFDSDIGKDLAIEVREYFIPDFSNWEDSKTYEEGIKKLLRDLDTSS